MSAKESLRDEPLPKLVEALRPYKPRAIINFRNENLRQNALDMGKDLEAMGVTVVTRDDVQAEYESCDGDEINHRLRKFDFVIDIDDGEETFVEDFSQVITKESRDIQMEKPEGRYYRMKVAPDREGAKKATSRKEKAFSWSDDKDKKDVVLEMINRMEPIGYRASPWEAQFGERAYLLELPCAVFSLADFLPPERRYLIKELLGEYDTLVLVDNKNGASETLPFDVASDTFDLHHRDNVTTLDCGGCGDPRGAIPIAPTEHGNGILVVESCTCENCGRFYSALFDKANLLKDVLAKRGN